MTDITGSRKQDDTLTLICGAVGFERDQHGLTMTSDHVNRVQVPTRFSPEDIQRIQRDYELLAGMFRDHPGEMAQMLEAHARKDFEASRSMATALGYSEKYFEDEGGGIFWGVVAGFVACDIFTRCISSFFPPM
ncbi:hypothetical protein [Streptomyces sp. NPDC057238]|uniref:hypothetical protein n=1 Tax=Streptomyces sp. NPDC057238 TaxID=3346060 RepID=UPI003631F03E